MCHHCSEKHSAGHRDCSRHQEEQKIIQIAQREKVTFQRARQIVNEKPIARTVTSSTNSPFPTIFDVTLPKGEKEKKPMASPEMYQECNWEGTSTMPR